MDLFNLRRDFKLHSLDESEAMNNPILMFRKWMSEAIEADTLEATAFTLSTIEENNFPSSRVLLLKEVKEEGFVFFTNYNGQKGEEIASNNKCAMNFVWHELERQVRIQGLVEKISEEESDAYFAIRPRDSQIGAWASPQSEVIPNREFLDTEVEKYKKKFDKLVNIPRPPYWGGYLLKPIYIEFWQGRSNRLHDRIVYSKNEDEWIKNRLAP